jgi:hypothetical protein
MILNVFYQKIFGGKIWLLRECRNVSELKIHLINKKLFFFILQEEFEDTKGVIKIRKSKKDRQHNGETKQDKRTNNTYI